jgi:hypothetical protein
MVSTTGCGPARVRFESYLRYQIGFATITFARMLLINCASVNANADLLAQQLKENLSNWGTGYDGKVATGKV